MKKFFSLAVLMVLIAPNAFASKARLLALGQDPNGSPYLVDTRSVFLNPAYINSVGDFANFELGNTDGTTPNSEGGFFHQWGGYHIGLELGRQTDFTQFVNTINTTPSSVYAAPQNSFEVQMGGGDAYKWGLSFLYGMAEIRPSSGPIPTFSAQKSSTYEFRAGIIHDNWDVHGAIDALGSAQSDLNSGGNTKLVFNPSVKFGGTYDWRADEKLYFDAILMNYKQTVSGSDSAKTVNTVEVGYAHFLSPEAATKFFYAVGLAYKDDNAANIRFTGIPLTIGVENAATDWLKLRAAVKQNVIIDQHVSSVTNTNNPNTTTVSAGVGLNWKKIIVDGTLAGSTAPPAGNNPTAGRIDGNNFLANASMTYMF